MRSVFALAACLTGWRSKPSKLTHVGAIDASGAGEDGAPGARVLANGGAPGGRGGSGGTGGDGFAKTTQVQAGGQNLGGGGGYIQHTTPLANTTSPAATVTP